jgi:hypothetical protein
MEYGSEKVLCPFYKTESRNTLKCEGDFSESCVFNFFSSTEKNAQKENFCNKIYSECPHYKQVMKKYP